MKDSAWLTANTGVVGGVVIEDCIVNVVVPMISARLSQSSRLVLLTREIAQVAQLFEHAL